MIEDTNYDGLVVGHVMTLPKFRNHRLRRCISVATESTQGIIETYIAPNAETLLEYLNLLSIIFLTAQILFIRERLYLCKAPKL